MIGKEGNENVTGADSMQTSRLIQYFFAGEERNVFALTTRQTFHTRSKAEDFESMTEPNCVTKLTESAPLQIVDEMFLVHWHK